jgi:hypothetical protein
MVRKVLLGCGMVSSLLYVAMNILGAIRFEGYSSVSQSVSELSAIGAPSRPLWVALGISYDMLIMAFGLGVWISADGRRALRILGSLLVVYGALGLPWMLWAPMHLRGEASTFTDTMHIVFAMVTVLLMMVAMAFGAAALGKRFRLYSIATIVLLLGFGALAGSDGPKIAANLPTPQIGVWERIDIALFLLWVIVLAAALWRKKKLNSATGRYWPDMRSA